MTTMARERTASFRGGMNDSAASADDFGAEECSLIYNGRIDHDGAVEACYGSIRLNDTQPDSDYGRGLFTFTTAAGAKQLIRFIEDGGSTIAAYSTNNGKDWTNMATGLAVGDWSAATITIGGTNYIYFAVGTTTMYRWSGSAWAASTGPVANIKYLATFNERLWASPGTSTIYASETADAESWAAPDGLVLPIQTHDAEPVLNIAAAGGVLLVQKRNSTSYVDGFGNSDIIVAAGARGISGSVGTIAPRSFQYTPSGAVWLSDRGIELWPGGDAPVQQIALGAREYWATSVARNRITNTAGTGSGPTVPCSVYWPTRNEYWIAWPSDTYADDTSVQPRNDEGLIVNLTTGAVGKRVWNPPLNVGSRKLHPAAFCVMDLTNQFETARSFTQPLCLTKDGDVLEMDWEYMQDEYATPTGDTGYTLDFRFRSRLYDANEPTRRKWWRQVRVGHMRATSATGGNWTAFPLYDGTAGTSVVTTAPSSPTPTPLKTVLRVSGRALNVQVEIQARAGYKVTSLEVLGLPIGSEI